MRIIKKYRCVYQRELSVNNIWIRERLSTKSILIIIVTRPPRARIFILARTVERSGRVYTSGAILL